jgi:hypothetical protein
VLSCGVKKKGKKKREEGSCCFLFILWSPFVLVSIRRSFCRRGERDTRRNRMYCWTE